MKTEVKPVVKICFDVELEVEYNSFTAGPLSDFAERIQDDMNDALMEMRPEIIGSFTSIIAIND